MNNQTQKAGRITALFCELVLGDLHHSAGQLVIDTLVHPQISDFVKVQVVEQILHWMHRHLAGSVDEIEESIIHAATQHIVYLESGRGAYRRFRRGAVLKDSVDLPAKLPNPISLMDASFLGSIARLCHDEGGSRLSDCVREQKRNLLAICHEWRAKDCGNLPQDAADWN